MVKFVKASELDYIHKQIRYCTKELDHYRVCGSVFFSEFFTAEKAVYERKLESVTLKVGNFNFMVVEQDDTQ